jgi:hypothetical protein
MCEHSGNDLGQTIDRTARLAAYLMRAYDIPLDHVVPHYHWPRKGLNPPHKDCPHFLLETRRPGHTWRWFLNRVNFHHSRMLPGPADTSGLSHEAALLQIVAAGRRRPRRVKRMPPGRRSRCQARASAWPSSSDKRIKESSGPLPQRPP